MSFSPEQNELLQRLLRQTDQSPAVAAGAHLDDETLALFSEGALPSDQRETVIAHLAECLDCRQAASALLSMTSDGQEDSSASPAIQLATTVDPGKRTTPRAVAPWSVTVAAIAMLAAVGIWLGGSRNPELADRKAYQQAETLLAQADYNGARDVLEQARRQGVRSDRLLSLESQAVRHLPGSLALASAGRLTNFGFDVDGTVARGTENLTGLREAGELLNQARGQQLELLLNRGHWALANGEHQKAAADFEQATKMAPEQVWGWLGLGLARFHADDFEGAAAAFRRCLEIDAANVSARINLAMTLQELGRLAEAANIWKSLQQEELPAADRQLVERALDALRDQ